MVIDPAPVDVFQINSFATIKIPFEIVNLGTPGQIPQTALASGIAKSISKSTYYVIEDASHFSMFGECKIGAAELAVAEEVGDPICADGGRLSRVEIHMRLIAMAAKAFSRALKSGL